MPSGLPFRIEPSTPTPSRSASRSEEHTSELQSQSNLVCRLLLEKKKKTYLPSVLTISQYAVNLSLYSLLPTSAIVTSPPSPFDTQFSAPSRLRLLLVSCTCLLRK